MLKLSRYFKLGKILTLPINVFLVSLSWVKVGFEFVLVWSDLFGEKG